MAQIRNDLEGLKELLDILKTLENEKEVERLLRSANRESLKDLQKQFKSGLPYSKRLLKYIKIGATKVKGRRHPNAQIVGPTSDAFVIRFLEKGTVERYTKGGSYKGKITGKHAIESFLDSNANVVKDKVISEYGEQLVKVTEKKAKRINKNRQ